MYRAGGEMISLHSPQEMPDPGEIERIEEPYLKAKILIPPDYVGAVMELTTARRGTFVTMNYLSPTTVEMIWEIPLSELIMDYFDKLKSNTKGYAEPRLRLRRLQALQAGEAGYPAVRQARGRAVVHRAQGQGVRPRPRAAPRSCAGIIPRQMFEVPIQAAIGGRVLARETVKAKRKDVLAKCYGGDISRKRKLLEKQKAGKKRMKNIGNVEVPQEAFMAILKVDD